MARYRRIYTVEGTGDEIAAMDLVFKRIHDLTLRGSSRDIIISVDGDGSASLKCMGEDGERIVFNKDFAKEVYDHEGDEFPISVGDIGLVGEMKKDGTMRVWIGE